MTTRQMSSPPASADLPDGAWGDLPRAQRDYLEWRRREFFEATDNIEQATILARRMDIPAAEARELRRRGVPSRYVFQLLI